MMRKMPLFLLTMVLLLLGGLLIVLTPAQTFSALENRTLAQLPSPERNTALNGVWGEALEAYAMDQFPLRNELISCRAMLRLLSGDRWQADTLAGHDGWLLETPPDEVTRTALRSVETLSELADGLGLPGYLMLIPTSAAVVPQQLPPLYTCGSQADVLNALKQHSGGLTWVDSTLLDHVDDTTLYYRTDHHLTSEGASLCYQALCAALEFVPNQGDITTMDGFRGSYFARIPSPSIAAEIFRVELPSNVTVTLDGEEAPGFLDEEKQQGQNKYAALLGGTYAHAVLENPNADGQVLVICDSYANAIAPMLSTHYGRVDLIDPRYYTGDWSALMQTAQCEQMIAIFGLNTISTNRSILLMDIPERSNLE